MSDPRPRDEWGRFAKQVGEEESRRPATRAPSRVSPTQPVGVGGTAIFSGFVEVREKDSRLTGRERYRTYSNILANVPIVSAGVRYFLNLVSKAGWKAEPADDSPRAVEIAEQVEEMMDDMATPWHRVVRRAAMFRLYGFSIQEWTAKRRDDGSFGMQDVEPRPQITIERWDTDRSGTVLGVIQRSPQTQEEIPIPREKLVYLVDDSLSDSPEGIGLFRHLVEPADRLQRYERLEAVGYEGDLKGVPKARGPFTELAKMVKAGQIDQATADSIQAPLKNFVKGHIRGDSTGLLLDSQTWQTTDERHSPSSVHQWDVELLDGGTYSLAEVAQAITRVIKEMARILGVEHLLLGEDSAGSFALSRDKSHNFGLIVDSTLKELRESFQADWVGPLAKLNGWPDELVPKLKTEQVQYRDIEQISKVLSDMASAGVVIDREDDLVNEVLDLLGLSKLQPMEEMDPDLDLVPPGQPPQGREPTEPDEVPEGQSQDGAAGRGGAG